MGAVEQARAGTERLRTRVVTMADPGVRPMVDELTAEYADRYGPDTAAREMDAHPDAEFAPPHGGVVLVEEDGVPVAGGAFRRHDAGTAELKRVWSSRAHRRRGLARRAVEALEAEAARRGYTCVHLSTGPNQPEAVALYRALGYALSDVEGVDPSGQRLYYAFAKALPDGRAEAVLRG
ncbi:GNAT family N-acetyltransferase [Nocardiopsis mangrovi]|uniref:GNAT family N-acetyltransferase n=1 Tax=Nocardiopsis mangrovi TaxID=1179818 RepID=A0ABV9DUG1_9ACTN